MMSTAGEVSRIRYREGCLGAHALNVIGDRWGLLVVRELMFAPKRFQMIRAGLPGITASVLTQRLSQLVQAGVISHDAALGTYALTDAGRALHPVLRELCRWALLMPGHDPTQFISISALMISIAATVDSERAQDVRGKDSFARAGFVSGSEAFVVTLSPAGVPEVMSVSSLKGDDRQADFILQGSGNALAMAIYGPMPVADLAASGQVALQGDDRAAQSFVDLFSLKPGLP